VISYTLPEREHGTGELCHLQHRSQFIRQPFIAWVPCILAFEATSRGHGNPQIPTEMKNMSVVRYQPVRMIRQFHDQVNRLMQDGYGTFGAQRAAALNQARTGSRSGLERRDWTPAMDVKEEDDRYVISADVPGVDPKDIEITMQAGVLSIKGNRGPGSEQETSAYSRIERVHGGFERRFSLPKGADADGIAATSSHGVLNVSIPKIPESQPRRIEIQ
jgi:HSP20 family protein